MKEVNCIILQGRYNSLVPPWFMGKKGLTPEKLRRRTIKAFSTGKCSMLNINTGIPVKISEFSDHISMTLNRFFNIFNDTKYRLDHTLFFEFREKPRARAVRKSLWGNIGNIFQA